VPGRTELERIADVTSLPFVDDRQACAVAYQGRVACFDIVRGTLNWSRDVSSLSGIVADARYMYVTDDSGAIHALDKATGAQKWTLADLTPIAVMIQQPSGFYVAEGSRFKTWSDVESEAKSKGLKVGISGFGSPDDVTIGYFNSKGFKFQAVPFATARPPLPTTVTIEGSEEASTAEIVPPMLPPDESTKVGQRGRL